MKHIQGKYANAIIYTDLVEQEALDQVKAMCDDSLAAGQRIRIMPDVHAGAGCTIGTTMTVGDRLMPSLVGVDIGCGMLTVGVGRQPLPLDKLDEVIYRSIPSGQNVRQSPHAYLAEIDLSELRCAERVNRERAALSLGTLGGGNHFIEADVDEEGNQYLVIHSGSRHLGHQVATYYMKAGYEQMELEGVKQWRDVVAELKAQGRFREIEAQKETFVLEKNRLDIPLDRAYVSGPLFKDYIHDMSIVQRFAQLNRRAMMDTILEELNLTETERFETVHNYIDMESMISHVLLPLRFCLKVIDWPDDAVDGNGGRNIGKGRTRRRSLS